MSNRNTQFIIITTIILTTLISQCSSQPQLSDFNQERAYQDVLTQVSFGPRTPISEAHDKTVSWIIEELNGSDWEVEIFESIELNTPIKNVVAKRGQGEPWIILGAHYDSRLYADRDPNPKNHMNPVPGANDGASGVAVLLELARVIPEDDNKTIWLVFFDAEDNGNIADWDWILGSRAFVRELEGRPDAVIILDMIGDVDLNIHKEKSSDTNLTASIWEKANALGYSDYFLPTQKYRILDDHTPFLEMGIPAVDIIDFDYSYYHTISDTPDKVSPDSLKIVGDTILSWILDQ